MSFCSTKCTLLNNLMVQKMY